MSEQENPKVDKLMVTIIADMNLNQMECTEFLGRFVTMLKNEKILNHCLRDLDSREWMILYKAVIEVEAGL